MIEFFAYLFVGGLLVALVAVGATIAGAAVFILSMPFVWLVSVFRQNRN